MMQTLREAINKRRLHPSDYEATIRALELPRLADLTILDRVGLVAMDVEAGDAAVLQELVEGYEKGESLRRILTACIPGIIVPDEVVELGKRSDDFDEFGNYGGLHSGDTIHITRKSTLHPPVNEEE